MDDQVSNVEPRSISSGGHTHNPQHRQIICVEENSLLFSSIRCRCFVLSKLIIIIIFMITVIMVFYY
jgi:hypothetical protein